MLNIDEIFEDWDDEEYEDTETIVYSKVIGIKPFSGPGGEIILECYISKKITERRTFSYSNISLLSPRIGDQIKIIIITHWDNSVTLRYE